MCGIGGVIRFDEHAVRHERLRAMAPTLRTRGDDDFATFTDRSVGLAHARLRVIDPVGGAQPMTDPFGDLTVVYNGEIYNHRSLRHQLERFGHRFTSDHADTEVLLHGYRQWGEHLCEHLDGMFAFALYDHRRRTVYFARDRVGKKPLWIRRLDDRWVFGSHVSTVLVGSGRRPLVNPGALRHYLTFGYVNEHSLLQSVSELPAAHWLVVGPGGRAKGQRYWSPPSPSRPHKVARLAADDPEQAIADALTTAVEKRLESDVPLGCFLSGGIDSSIVAAIAQSHLGARLGRLRTFSVAMPDARYDESPVARRVAAHIGAEHHELDAAGDVERDLRTIVETTGEPLGDSSLLPTFWLSRAAKREVTVALSGDGGDELFGGYDRYRAMRLIRRHRAWMRFMPAVGADGETKSTASRVGRLVRAARGSTPDAQYLDIIRIFGPRHLERLGLQQTQAALSLPTFYDPAQAARAWDFEHYLPFDLLRKVDRASMSVALEVRCPLLDTAVMDLALSMPMRALISGSQTKSLLRRVASRWLPPDVVSRPKMGFAIPIGGWFAGPMREMLERWLLDEPALASIGMASEALEALIAEHAAGDLDHTQRLFTLLSLSMWLRWVNSDAAVRAEPLAPALA